MPTILVVDDEPGICTLISRILNQNGFSVLTATSGEDAITLSRTHQGEIEMVITDVRMPFVDGPSLVKALSAADPGLPILFISGQCDPVDLNQFEMSEFLAKPFSVDSLLEAVRDLLPIPGRSLVN